MSYAIGIDLGTTYTAAAIWRDGRAEIAPLGSRAAAIPSVVLLREDETVLTGETAHRRGMSEPHRVSREFKRRLGDTIPILLGGVPYSAEALMARLLRSVVDGVAQREGGPPARLCVSHPANWGSFKQDLLGQAVRLSGLEMPVVFTTEPEAAAAFYAQQQRLEPGAVVAVYDLGGGTFDAAVLRKTAAGFEILGQPEGIERLGGIDFDAAVFEHVRQALGGQLAELPEDDPAAVAAVARLREECVAAKEALSGDTDASVPVLLPNLATEVRLTRIEFETMVRPALHSTIEALRRALRSAQVTPEQLHSVLLVGGSSRIPLVSQLVGAELGRPVAVDAHPKHAVAMGAAWLASGVPATAPPPATPPPATPPPATPPPTASPAAVSAPSVPPRVARPAAVAYAGSAAVPRGVTAPLAPPEPPAPAGRRSRHRLPLVAALAAAFVLAAGTVAWAVTSRDAGGTTGASPTPSPAATPPAEETRETTGRTSAPPPPPPTEAPTPPDEQCGEHLRSNPRWVCLTSATIVDGQLVITYEAEWAESLPDVNGGYHLHIYGGDGSNPADEVMGSHAGAGRGVWKIRDQHPAVLSAGELAEVVGDHPKVCARIADGNHALVPAVAGGYTTGNCIPIT